MSHLKTFCIGQKKLIVDRSCIYLESKLFNKKLSKPCAIRYGVAPIELEMFTIGVNYKIDLKNEDGEKLSISIRSYFGLGRHKKYEQHQSIIGAIWNNFFEDTFARKMEGWEGGASIKIDKYQIDSTCITKFVVGRKKGVAIRFEEMELLPRYDHLLINSTVETGRYMKLEYLMDWNWPLVFDILEKAKENKGRF